VAIVPGFGTPVVGRIQGFGPPAVFKSIVTGFQWQAQAGVQFAHSLRDFVYLYLFGDRTVPVTISGLSFAHMCTEGTPSGDGGVGYSLSSHGLEFIANYYDEARVSRIGVPVGLVFGLTRVLTGFLVGVNCGYTDPEHLVGQWSLSFMSVPASTVLDVRR
jgi:hypothetical protein